MKRIATVVGLVLATGCVADGLDDAGEPGLGGGFDDTDDKADGEVAPGYALALRSKMLLRDTSTGAESTYDLRARARVTATHTDETVRLSVKLCDVKLPEVSGYKPALDADFVASLPAYVLTGALVDGELTTEPTAIVLGAQLAKPLTTSMPASATDARVKDQDGDGNPGVSIAIPGYGSIFAALRVKLSLSATLDSAAAFAGDATFELDQAIFGDDIWFYDAASSAAETAANTEVLDAANTFQMKAGATSCAQVRTAFPQ